MRLRRRRVPPELETHEIDPRVPHLADWDPDGIIGTIGSGPSTGCTVVAHIDYTPAGAFSAYWLEVVEGSWHLVDAAGTHVLDDGATDPRIPGEEGGLIDALTRELDVKWWTDRTQIDAFWQRHYDS